MLVFKLRSSTLLYAILETMTIFRILHLLKCDFRFETYPVSSKIINFKDFTENVALKIGLESGIPGREYSREYDCSRERSFPGKVPGNPGNKIFLF